MSSEWNAELIAKFDSDRALKERLDELRRTYRGLPLEGVTGRSFVGRLIEIILEAGYPALSDLAQVPDRRFILKDDKNRAVFAAAPYPNCHAGEGSRRDEDQGRSRMARYRHTAAAEW